MEILIASPKQTVILENFRSKFSQIYVDARSELIELGMSYELIDLAIEGIVAVEIEK